MSSVWKILLIVPVRSSRSYYLIILLPGLFDKLIAECAELHNYYYLLLLSNYHIRFQSPTHLFHSCTLERKRRLFVCLWTSHYI